MFEIVDTEGYWLPSDDGSYQIMSDVGKPITGQGYRCRIILRAKKYCRVRILALIKKDCKFEVTDKAGAHSYSSQSNLYYLDKGSTFYIDCISKTKDGAGVYWSIDDSKEQCSWTGRSAGGERHKGDLEFSSRRLKCSRRHSGRKC